MAALAIAAGAAALLARQSVPQTPAPPAFRAATALVPVDVRVVDKQGNPVTDLTQADFTVLENGRAQDIRLFAKETLTPEPVPAPPPGGSSLPGASLRLVRATDRAALAPQTYRVYLVVLGRGRLQNVAKGTDGIIHLVQDVLLPQDRVAVLAWNRATDFTTDHARIAEVLARFKKANDKIESEMAQFFSGLLWLYGNRQIPDYIQRDVDAVFGGPRGGAHTVVDAAVPDATRVEEDVQRTVDQYQAPSADTMSQNLLQDAALSFDAFIQTTAQTGQDVGNIYTGINYLREIEGEKHLLWLTETGLTTERAEDDANLARTAADARVVLDIIRTGGTAMTSGMSAENRRPPSPIAEGRAGLLLLQPSATSRTLANITGGRYDANHFANASADVEVIERGSRSQYLLGYYPSNPALDDRFRNITVRVNRPDVTLMYRHGYYATRDAPVRNAQEALTYNRVTGAARYPKDIPDIGLRAVATRSGTTRPGTVNVNVTVDISRVVFTRRDGLNLATLQLAAFLLDKNQRDAGVLWQTMELSLTDARRQALAGTGVSVTLVVPSSAVPAVAKVVVYDYDGDLAGSTTAKIAP